MPQKTLQDAIEEARVFRETQRGEGFLSSLGSFADQTFSFFGNLPNQIAFGSDFPAIREQSIKGGAAFEERARKPQSFSEKLGAGLGASLAAAPLAAAAAAPLAGTVGALGVNAVAGLVGGGLEGAAVPNLFGAETRLGGAAVGGIAGGILGAGLPVGLRPLTKYIPGVKNLLPNVTLREAFEESLRTASIGEARGLAGSLFPQDDVIDQFLAGSGRFNSDAANIAGLQGMRLRSLGEAVDSQVRGINGDLPFRQLKGSPQFHADTIVQKGVKAAGLSSRQAKFLMESLTDHERVALSQALDPFTESIDPGGLPLSQAMIRAVERVAGPEKQAMVKRFMSEGIAGSGTFKQQLIKSLEAQGVKQPSEEAIARAAREVDLAIDEEPMLGVMLPQLFEDGMLTPGQASRMAANMIPSEYGKSPLRQAVGKGTTSLFGFLRNVRIAGMLTSLTAPAKNIAFNGINVAANVTGRGVAGIGSKRVYGGEAMALVKGMWRGIDDSLARYGAMSRFLRESENGTRIPVLSLGSDFLKATDKWFFNRIFAGEMHAEAFKVARRSGLKGLRALNATDTIIEGQAKAFGPVYQKAFLKAGKKAAAEGVEANRDIGRMASQLIRNAGEEPLSIQEARLMAERAIFVAKEGRVLDKLLDVADVADVATNGLVSVVTPFRRTPANEIREFVRASGGDLLGLALRRIRQDVSAGIPEEIARTRAARDIGKAAVGATTTAGLMFALAHGVMRVGDDEGKSRAQIDTERAQGIPRRSLQIGNWVIPLHVMGPIGRIVNQADILLKNSKTAQDPESLAKALGEVSRQVTLSLGDDFLTSDWIGLNDAMQSQEGMQRYAQRFGASFVPGILRQGKLNKEGRRPTITRPSKDERSIPSAAAAGFFAELTPFTDPIAETLGIDPPRVKQDPIVGLFGEIAKEGDPGSRVIGASRKSGLIAQTAAQMQQLGIYKEAPDTNIPGVEWLGVEETDFAVAKGQLQLQAVRRVMEHPGFATATPEMQAKFINSEMRKASRLANGRARAAKQRGMPVTGRLILSGRVGP